jgi:rhodanese-related sulfurtransferase
MMKAKKLMINLSLLLISVLFLSACRGNLTDDTYGKREIKIEEPVTSDVYDEESEEKIVMEEDIVKDEKVEYKKISPDEAKAMMIEGNLILDVRTPAEYGEGHIQNAVLHPVDDITSGNLGTLDDKDQVILVYCRSGNRSRTASNALIEAGYTQVYDFGGIIDWPYEVVID